MPRLRAALCLPLAALLVAGCSGTSPVVTTGADGQTFYRSEPVPLQPELRNTGLASVNEIAVRAIAECRGEGCRPETVTLALQNRQSRDIVTTFSNIEITIDGQMQEWQDGTFRDPNRPSVRAGEFIQIEIQPDLFRRMAEAQDVRLQLGGTRYRLVHNRRATFRQMAAAMGLR